MLSFFSRRNRKESKPKSRYAAGKQKQLLGLEALESRTLLAAAPVGAVSVFNKAQITGWAYDAADGAAPMNVIINVNGVTTTVAANVNRPGLIPLFGSPYHGFTFNMPALAPGVNHISVRAISPSTGAWKILKTGTLNNPLPTGQVTTHSNTLIAGWAYDASTTSPIQIRVDLDGVEGTPITTNVARPVIAARSHVSTPGFSVSGSFAGKVVEVFAIDASSGKEKLLWTNNKPPKGALNAITAYQVTGWAYDPNHPTASVDVLVTIDGLPIAGSPAAASITRNDLLRKIGSTDHGFSVPIAGLTPGRHVISVFALDGEAGSAPRVLLGTKTFINRPPVGHVDVVNSSVIKGWALDPDLGAGPTTITIYVDDTPFTSLAAAVNRPGLRAMYGSTNHGFSVDLSSLAPGSHSISVTATDNRFSLEREIVIFDDFINNHQPIGHIDSIANNIVTGWAQDPDAPTAAAQVDIYVDGVYATTVVADDSRPDLTGPLGSANHGFAVTLPGLTFGVHRIDVYAAESQNNVSTLIGRMSVNNRRPAGDIEVINQSTISGWAYDPDVSTASVSIKVYVNGVQAGTTTANLTRNDLTPALGSANHGFSITMPTLLAGRNQVDIYAVDVNNGLISVLDSREILV